jgi:hypothetical protein
MDGNAPKERYNKRGQIYKYQEENFKPRVYVVMIYGYQAKGDDAYDVQNKGKITIFSFKDV